MERNSDISRFYAEHMRWCKMVTSVLQRMAIECLRGSDNVAVLLLLPPIQEAGVATKTHKVLMCWQVPSASSRGNISSNFRKCASTL